MSIGVAPSSTPLSFRWRRAPFDIAGATNSTLVITNIQVASGGAYAVTVANAAGSVVSDTATLTVAEVRSQSVSVGANVTFKLDTRGSAVSGLQWQFKGAAIAGATNSSLALANAQLAQAGTYALSLTNAAGSVTVPVKLEVDPTFTKITTGDVATVISSHSGAWGDSDNDGFLDLFTAYSSGTGSTTNFLYRNKGDGTFTTIIPDAPLVTIGDSTAGVWADYDNDGHLDLFVSRGAASGRNTNLLYRNQSGGVLRIAAAGDPVMEVGVFTGAAWADYDGDGFVDLFVANGSGLQSRDFLYRNMGDGTFVRTTANAIVDEATANYTGAWSDYDNDGDPDLFVPNGGTEGNAFLFQNNGDGTFQKITSGAAIAAIASALSAAWGDYDNDGFQDLFLGNNGLFRNNSDGTFTKITSGEIVENPGGFSRVGAWGDYDNDGFLDLFVSTSLGGHRLFHNNGDGSFTRITSGSLANDPPGGFGDCAWADYNNDGFLDLFVANGSIGARDFTPNYLYRNNGNTNTWIQIKCVGALSNRSGIGAKVRVKSEIRNQNSEFRTEWQLREISSGFGGQNNLRAHFGLGNATNIDTVRIEWPSGIVQEMRNVAPKQILTVTEEGVAIVPRAQNLVVGSNHVFTAKATFSGPRKYQWRLNGADLPGETNSSLIVKSVATLQAGEYSVAVRDAAGAVLATSSPALLRLNDPPVIVSQPQSQIAVAGTDVTLSVGVVPSATALSFQWFKDGNPLPALSLPTLVLTNAQPINGGSYTVVVSNAVGSVMSAVAGVTIIRDTSISGSLGANVTLGIASSGPPLTSIQWRFNGADIPGATSSTFVITNAQLANVGQYSAVVASATSSVTNQAPPRFVDPTFTKITTGPVVNDGKSTHGGAWGDYDNDGDLDLFVAVVSGTAGGNNLLYQNNGDGSFTKATPAMVGSVVGDVTDSVSGSWGDYDNDGFLDLFVGPGTDVLYHNNRNGTFTRISSNAVGIIVPGSIFPHSAAWADYDNDGFLDLFVATSGSPYNLLYHNNGNGTFARATIGPVVTDLGVGEGCAWGDYDNDGYPDLFVANSTNSLSAFLYHNNGNGTFTRITESPIADGRTTVGGAWGDFDNDGDLDLFVPSWGGSAADKNFLYRNNGDGTFTKLTNGPVVSEGGSSRTASWGDYDNDGFLDLFVGNLGSTRVAGLRVNTFSTNNFLYHNNGDGTFAKVTTGSPVNDARSSLGSSWADYDNDGFLDLFVSNVANNESDFLYRNSSNGNSWIKIKCVGTLSNRSGIGAKVRVQALYAGARRWQLREITTGDGFQNSPPPEAHFGLGNATNIDTVRIEWPSGIVQEMHNVAVKQFLTVPEPKIVVAPKAQEISSGASASFSFSTDLTNLTGIQWRLNGVELKGETNSTLTVSNAGAASIGKYSVEIRHAGGAAISARVRLDVRIIQPVADSVTVSTLAGSGAIGSTDGNGPSAQFGFPNAGFVDAAGNIYIADQRNNRIRKIGPQGVVTTLAGAGLTGFADGPSGSALFNGPLGVAVDLAGNVYVADTGNNRIRKIDGAGMVTTVAGSGTAGYRDGPAATAQFDFPNDLAVDKDGNLYVSEFQNHTIRKITPAGTVSTVAGQAGNPGYADGSAAEALFNQPGGIAIDGQGNLYVTEWSGHRVRKIGVDGKVTTVAGNGLPGYVDGVGPHAQFNTPDGIVVDLNGNIYITEFGNDVIRRITPAGLVKTVAGSGVRAFSDGSGVTAQFNDPGGIGLDASGNLYVADTSNHRLRKIVAVQAQETTFTKITSDSAVTAGLFSGVAWGDYDNDGFLDLITASALFRNTGAGAFTRSGEFAATTGVAWGDYDNDGFLDRFVAAVGGDNRLDHNRGNGTFTTVISGNPAQMGANWSCVWGDYDNDGFIDLFVTNRRQTGVAGSNSLFRNNGNGTFTAMTPNTVGSMAQGGSSASSCAWADYDNDGFIDMMVWNRPLGPSLLYRNNGNGTFSQITEGNIATDTEGSYSGAWGDYDNDGFLDLFVAGSGADSRLYHNKGDGTFDRVTTGIVVADGSGHFCAWGDYDNDGYLDLVVTQFANPNRLYHNNGDGTFTKVTSGILVNEDLQSTATAWADYDNDGFLDLVVANVRANPLLYRNNGNGNNWITIKCVGTTSNRSGIGAKVTVKATFGGKEHRQFRQIFGGDGFSGASLDAHFGLGSATNIDTVRIEWPSGMVQEMRNVAVKQILTITEPSVSRLFRAVLNRSTGALQLILTAPAGERYAVEASTDLINWTRLTTLTSQTGTAQYTDPASPNFQQRFYRAVKQ